MPSFEDPVADAAEAHQALRGLAHATRTIDDAHLIYDVLGSLTAAAASFDQALHQLAESHDRAARRRVHVDGDASAGRAAAFQVSWELRRTGDILREATAALARAHEIEAQITFDRGHLPPAHEATRATSSSGPAL